MPVVRRAATFGTGHASQGGTLRYFASSSQCGQWTAATGLKLSTGGYYACYAFCRACSQLLHQPGAIHRNEAKLALAAREASPLTFAKARALVRNARRARLLHSLPFPYKLLPSWVRSRVRDELCRVVNVFGVVHRVLRVI